MIDFGYGINKDRQIDYDINDRRMARMLVEKEPSFKLCISCGTCTATCSAARFTPFNLRELILLIKRGEIKTVRTEIEKCMMCGKCILVCPRGINTRNMILNIHRIVEQMPEI